MIKKKIHKDDSGRTLLKYLKSTFSSIPNSLIEKALRNKDIKINDIRVKDKNYIVQEGDKLQIFGLNLKQKTNTDISEKAIEVIYEDDNILVVNKPQKLVMHGEEDSLDGRVFNYLKFEKEGSFTPASIGRLDRLTSGLVIYGKTYEAVRQMKENTNHFIKIYDFKSDLDKTITTQYHIRDDINKEKQVVAPDGVLAKTIFKVEGRRKTAQLVTGKKHQIRVSLQELGFPVHGDRKYGGIKAKRLYLHCSSISPQNLTGELEYLNGKKFSSNVYW